MSISVQFHSSTASLSSYQIQVNTPGRETREPATSATEAYVVDVKKTQAPMELPAPESPLSDKELEQFYSLYAKLGDKDPLYGEIQNLLFGLKGTDRTNFLTVISEAGDELEAFVHEAGKMEDGDLSTFLRTAVRVGAGETLSNLAEAVGSISGERLTRFLTMADQLNRTVESTGRNELANFLGAAAESPSDIDNLIQKTEGFEEGQDRGNFLAAAAAAGAGKEGSLSRLMAVMDSLEDKPDLSNFLAAAAGAGEGLDNLLDLTRDLPQGDRSEFLAFASTLGETDRENFLIATGGLDTDLPQLMTVTGKLGGENRSAFLSIVSRTDEPLAQVMDLVETLGEDTPELEDFLTAGSRAGDSFEAFFGMVGGLISPERQAVLAFASELSAHDLASFITAAGKAPAPAIAATAATAATLEEKDRSYFLYAAASGGEAGGLIEQTLALEGSDRSNFLFAAANAAEGQAQDDLIRTVKDLKGQALSDYLAAEKSIAVRRGDEEAASEYVFLNAAYDEETVTALLGAGASLDRLLDQLDAMDPPQREAFLSVAAAVGPEHVGELTSVVSGLQGDESHRFLEFSDGLAKKDLGSFITAADTAMARSGPDGLERLMDMARAFSSQERTDFLTAAAGAGDSLGDFMDMTGQFGGLRRTHFLSAASNVATRANGEQLMSEFIDSTQATIDRNHDYFMDGAKEMGRLAGRMILNKERFANIDYHFSIDNFLKSADSLHGADDTMTRRWIRSFTGYQEPV